MYTCGSPSVCRYMIFDNGTLRVTDVQLHDTAEYSCEVITDVDKVTAQASITVIGVCVSAYFVKGWTLSTSQSLILFLMTHLLLSHWLITTCTIGLLVLIVFILTWCKHSKYRGYVSSIFTMCHRHKNYFQMFTLVTYVQLKKELQ